jgi:hypothetical protein
MARRWFYLMVMLAAVLLSTASIGIAAAQEIPLPLPEPPLSGASFAQMRLNPNGPFRVIYPSAARPARITRKFIKPGPNRTPNEGADIYAPLGTAVIAGAPGVVRIVVPENDSLNMGAYVRIRTIHQGVRYNVTYAGLQNIQVTEGQRVEIGDVIGQSAGFNDSMKLVIQASQGGLNLNGFRLRNILNPRKVLHLPGIRVQPTEYNLRLRAAPNTGAAILGQVNPWDLLPVRSDHYIALVRAGKQNAWIPVRRPGVGPAFVAAWYVQVVSKNDPGLELGAPAAGMNLDLNFQYGTPPAAPLSELGYVRLGYNVSYNPANGTYGNTDLNTAYARYQPAIRRYSDAGIRVIVVLTHQFYGEGQGYNWDQMSRSQWQNLSAQFAAMAGQVASQYAGQRAIYAYQIWNEQDSAPGARAAVPVPSAEYALMLAQAITAIRSADPNAVVITGGHISGPDAGPVYARAVLAALPAGIMPDGIAIHPYGRGPAGSPFNVFGTIDESILKWSRVMPGRPLWITEWGVLDRQNEPGIAAQVAEHATGFLNVIETKYRGAVAAAVWYAWADGMDNGYGLVNRQNQPKEPLYSSYLNRRPLSLPPQITAPGISLDGVG